MEDHGYIIDFGVAGKTGFLLKKNATEFVRTCNKGKPLVRGQVMRCKVLSAVDARSVPVSVEPSLVGGALVGGNCLVQLHALQPGTLINAAVKEVRAVRVAGCMLMSIIIIYMYMYMYGCFFLSSFSSLI